MGLRREKNASVATGVEAEPRWNESKASNPGPGPKSNKLASVKLIITTQ